MKLFLLLVEIGHVYNNSCSWLGPCKQFSSEFDCAISVKGLWSFLSSKFKNIVLVWKSEKETGRFKIDANFVF